MKVDGVVPGSQRVNLRIAGQAVSTSPNDFSDYVLDAAIGQKVKVCGDTTPCRMTGVASHRGCNPVEDDRSDLTHGVVSPEGPASDFSDYLLDAAIGQKVKVLIHHGGYPGANLNQSSTDATSGR